MHAERERANIDSCLTHLVIADPRSLSPDEVPTKTVHFPSTFADTSLTLCEDGDKVGEGHLSDCNLGSRTNPCLKQDGMKP